MQFILTLFLILIWIGGTCYRIYKQARFYQIEEYKTGRYINWLIRGRQRWLPLSPILAVGIAMIIGFFTDSVPEGTAVMPYIAGIIGSLIAIRPQPEGEIKKAFVRTQRAQRMLGAAFAVVIALMLVSIGLLNTTSFSEQDRLWVGICLVIGLAIFLLAPLWLIIGNALMQPIEALMRRRYINRARSVMATVRPKVIGITGSYGKTTTKNFLRDILNGRYKTYATPKSYNTMMGVCIAINNDLSDDFSTEYFISEMGAYVPGEIARICDLTPPDISLVVEVGPQHLERFGSLENVSIAKYEIIKALRPDGLGVFNWDNPYVREMYERGYPQNRIAVSSEADPATAPADGPRFIATDIQEDLNGLSFAVTDRTSGENVFIQTPVVGIHNVTNLLMSIAVAVHEGMSLKEIALRTRMLKPAESRLVQQTVAGGVTIINDAYSANPRGVISALRVLGMHQTGRRVLITPGMVELGDLHEVENGKLGQQAVLYATDIVLVGQKQTEPIANAIRQTDFKEDHLMIVDTLSEAVAWYQSELKTGDTVLFLNDLPDTY